MKKISILNRHRFTANSFYVFCIFLIFLLAGCGGGSDNSFSSDLSENASASFTIAWYNAPVFQAAGPGPEPVDCTVVENIICKVYDGSDNTHLTSEVFDCYGGEGTIEDIPVGDNREFVILGEDADQNILYHGIASGITLEKGQTTDVGTIDTFLFVPEGLSVTADSSGQINLAWDGTDNVGVAGYHVYRSGEFLKSVTTTSTSDTALNPSTQYCYTVSAYDVWDNESGQSSPPACVTTPPIDNTPPTISNPFLELIQLNAPDCDMDGLPVGSLFLTSFEYTDPDGNGPTDISQAKVEIAWDFPGTGDGVDGVFSDYTLLDSYVLGDGYSGSSEIAKCFRFGNNDYVDVTITIEDLIGAKSNPLTVRIDKPDGSN
jgi:hypothetical protein